MGKKIKHSTIMFSSKRKNTICFRKILSLKECTKSNIHKDTKLSFAFPSSLFLGTLEDLNIKSQNFRPGNDIRNYQGPSYYFACKFKKGSRRGDLFNDINGELRGHEVGFLIKYES